VSTSSDLQSQDLEIDYYLWTLLQRARSVVVRARNLELAQFGVTIEQMSILHSLQINGGSASVDEIAANIVRQKNSVTTLIDRMAKIDLVKIEKLKTEKKYLITLTPKSQKIIDIVPRKSIEMIFSNFESEDKKRMAGYLEQIINTGLDLLGENYIPPFLLKKSPV
jgi:DNA-binding MarR family transcriptional regulator